MKKLIHGVFLLIFLAAAGYSTQADSKNAFADEVWTDSVINEWDRTIPGNFSAQCQFCFDSAQINIFLKKYPKYKSQAENIRRFYRGRLFSYAWFDENGLIEQAGNLINRIQNMEYDGTGKTIPYFEQFDSLMTEIEIAQINEAHPDPQAEVMLTAAYFAFAKVTGNLMDDPILDSVDWYMPRRKQDYQLTLNVLLEGKDTTINNHQPINKQYEQLRSYLKMYHDLELQGSWTTITPDRATYMVGDVSPVIGEIRKRLYVLGDLPADSASLTYTVAMKDGVKSFQHRHGLQEDGIIGPDVIKSLNVPPSQRVRTLMINMERCRWIPLGAPRDNIIINIPEFALHVYQKDSLIWSCKVIVGEVVHKTVVFNGMLKYIKFSPYWNVPYSISKNEYAGKGKEFYDMMNMDVLGYNGGVPTLRQRPGPGNALGQVKFVFPNSHSIYLHDTPMKPLFDRAERTFSHGCIRISEPKKLAMWLLRNDSSWDEERIDAAMEAGRERTVTLSNPVPVSIVYFTSFVDEKGKVNFRKDVYGRDTRLSNMRITDDRR